MASSVVLDPFSFIVWTNTAYFMFHRRKNHTCLELHKGELFSFLVEYPHLRKLILCPDMWYMPDEVMQTVLPSLGVKLESNLIMFLLKETHIT